MNIPDRPLLAAAGFWLCLLLALLPQAARADAADIYRRHGGAIFQVQVIDAASGRKTGIGSGFLIEDAGGRRYVATNYHVVAEMIQRPADNRLEFLHETAGTGGLAVAAADVVNDLALLTLDPAPDKKTAKKTATLPALGLAAARLETGARLFALGNPHDLGFTVIEGTFSGYSKETFSERIHFSGALNPGMSGGPALDNAGRVVGVNVSTAGNQISFLVPVRHLARLLAAPAAPDIGAQLETAQAAHVADILAAPWEDMRFAGFRVAGRVFPAFKCWGGAAHKDKDPFTFHRTECRVDENIFVDSNFTTGGIRYRYGTLVARRHFETARFTRAYAQYYGSLPRGDSNATERDAGNYDCHNGLIRHAGRVWKASYCYRSYRKYPALGDLRLYMADISQARRGFTAQLEADGVTPAAARALADRFIGAIRDGRKKNAKQTGKGS